MTIAVLSDIHGNLPALRAVLQEVAAAGISEIMCCGDIASGPMPGEVIDELMSWDGTVASVRGNADRAVVVAFDGINMPEIHEADRTTAALLARRHCDFLKALPVTIKRDLPELGRVCFCHGTPRNDNEIVLETTPVSLVEEMVAGIHADVILCGHTHMQFDRMIGAVRLVNVGSVGIPFDRPGAYWAILDETVYLRRTIYDVAAAARHLVECSHWPGVQQFAKTMTNPPSRASVLEALHRLERSQQK